MAGTIKTLFVGDFNSGKTSLLRRVEDDVFEETSPTVGVEFHIIECEGMEHKVTAWNLAGAPRFQEILKLYYASSQVIFIVIDSSQPCNVARWVGKCRNLCPDARIVLLFTKIDLAMHYTMQDTQLMARHYNVHSSVTVSSKEMNREEILHILMPCFTGIRPRPSCFSNNNRETMDPAQQGGLLCCLGF